MSTESKSLHELVAGLKRFDGVLNFNYNKFYEKLLGAYKNEY